VGGWLAELVVDGRSADDLSLFDPGRFGARAADRDWLVAESRRVYANYYSLAAGRTINGSQATS